MILQLNKIQLCLEGSELASARLEYYQTYHILFEHPPQRLQNLFDFKEEISILTKEYFDLFIQNQNIKYVFASKERDNPDSQQQINKSMVWPQNIEHFLFDLHYIELLIKKEKRQWQRKSYLTAMNLLYQQHNYLLEHLYWLPDFCSLVRRRASSQFYHEVALNLTNFFQLEKLLLERLLKEKLNMLN